MHHGYNEVESAGTLLCNGVFLTVVDLDEGDTATALDDCRIYVGPGTIEYRRTVATWTVDLIGGITVRHL